ncbi:MAG: catalase [Oscillibacter sp.]|nr:catalase [Oscillibacter sp.]
MKLWQHFKTVWIHRRLVRQYCFRLGLYWQGLTHDLSKYSPAEFCAGVKYYQGTRSPNDAQRRAHGYSAAWMHHKGHNRHHFEYWTDYGLGGEGIVGVEMPKKYVAEMFCDRIAASRVYRGAEYRDGDPYEFFLRGKSKRLLIHPATSDLLESLLLKLRDEGEDAAFDYVRREVLGKKS